MSAQDVRDFLLEFKQVATEGSGVDIIPRQETRVALAQFGLTMANLEQLLLDLTVANYHKGPEPDHDKPGHVWVFGCEIEDQEVYIKLKVAEAGGARIAKCISFHPAKFPLGYPHR